MRSNSSESGKWERCKVLGTGGFGVVTLWQNIDSGEKLAIKKCRWVPGVNEIDGTENVLTSKHVERWQKEVEIMNRLQHESVVKCFPVPPDLQGSDEELPVLCMEYCDGGDLRKVLNKSENCCGLSEAEVRRCLKDMAEATMYLHSLRIIHRDLKPENVVLMNYDGQIHCKLIDLGYAKELDQSSVCTSFVGTLQYLAPELFLSNRYNCTVDYWSLGLVAHELVTGLRPFLPQLTPVQWMKRVREKTRDQICVYEDADAKTVFSDQIFEQNHISKPFKKGLEEWLRLMLEWEPSERGHQMIENEKKLVAFSKLFEVLSRKVIRVFVVETNEVLEYEIHDSANMNEVMNWIYNDTQIDPGCMTFLLPRGQPPQMDKPASQCWAPPPDDEDWTLFLFSNIGFSLQKTAELPILVEKMLRNSREKFAYQTQRRMWAHAIFFVQTRRRNLKFLSQAQQVSMLNLISSHSVVTKNGQRMLASVAKLAAKHQMFLQSLNADLDIHQQISSSFAGTEINSKEWSDSGEAILRHFQSITSRVKTLESAITNLSTRLIEMQTNVNARSVDVGLNELEIIQQNCESLYTKLRRKNKETERKDESENAEMSKEIVNCIRIKDNIKHNLQVHLQNQLKCSEEARKLLEPLQTSLEEIARLAQFISNLQIRRQKQIWNIATQSKPESTISPISQNNSEILSKIQNNCEISSKFQNNFEISSKFQNNCEISSNFNSGGNAYDKTLEDYFKQSSEESQSLIGQNRTLRFQMLDLLSNVIPTSLNIAAANDENILGETN